MNITTKINKLLSQLETQVEQVFGEFSEDELKELLDNDLGEIIFNWTGPKHKQNEDEEINRN